jgi:hypothetical protein
MNYLKQEKGAGSAESSQVQNRVVKEDVYDRNSNDWRQREATRRSDDTPGAVSRNHRVPALVCVGEWIGRRVKLQCKNPVSLTRNVDPTGRRSSPFKRGRHL